MMRLMSRPESQLNFSFTNNELRCVRTRPDAQSRRIIQIRIDGNCRYCCRIIPITNGTNNLIKGASFHNGGTRDKAMQKVTVFPTVTLI
jgi:hypothetical protein